jgi:hypothetical protein
MLDFCTHVQNNDFLIGLSIGGKKLFQINGLLLFKYIVILMFKKNTKEMLRILVEKLYFATCLMQLKNSCMRHFLVA